MTNFWVRFFSSHDFRAHRPATGHICHAFLTCPILGHIRLVLYKDICSCYKYKYYIENKVSYMFKNLFFNTI